MTDKYDLKITSAIAIDGHIVTAGKIVTVDERTAKDLLRRGKAELATEEDAPAAAPLTREDLDAALDALPGENTDPDKVVKGMRDFFGELFTDDDEATVRELVIAQAKKPSDGLTVDQLQAALKAKGIEFASKATKAELAALLDAAPAAA